MSRTFCLVSMQQDGQLLIKLPVLVLNEVLWSDPFTVGQSGVSVIEDDLEEIVLVRELPERDWGFPERRRINQEFDQNQNNIRRRSGGGDDDVRVSDCEIRKTHDSVTNAD